MSSIRNNLKPSFEFDHPNADASIKDQDPNTLNLKLSGVRGKERFLEYAERTTLSNVPAGLLPSLEQLRRASITSSLNLLNVFNHVHVQEVFYNNPTYLNLTQCGVLAGDNSSVMVPKVFRISVKSLFSPCFFQSLYWLFIIIIDHLDLFNFLIFTGKRSFYQEPSRGTMHVAERSHFFTVCPGAFE